MSHHFTAVVEWSRAGERFVDNRYSRGHRWLFDGGVEVPASSAPSSVPLPLSREDAVDPEEAFVAALSSCHMLFFLHLAAKSGYLVESYRDEPVGTMTENADGKLFMSGVALAPRIVFGGDRIPDVGEIEDLHHRAHDSCYLANSVLAEITIATPPADR